MFVERLENRDYVSFAEKFSCCLCNVEKANGNKNEMHVVLMSETYGPLPEFWLSDFDCKVSDFYKAYERDIKNVWIRTLSQKFGSEYVDAYKAYVLKKANKDLQIAN